MGKSRGERKLFFFSAVAQRVAVKALAVSHELRVEPVVCQEAAVAHDKELQAGSRQGDIELAVHEAAVNLPACGDKVQLVWAAYGSAEYDDIALAALKAFHRVYRHVGER